jgi:DNA polymerase III delta subunit
MEPAAFILSIKDEVPSVTVCSGEEGFFKEEVFEALRSALERKWPGAQVAVWESLQGERDAAEVQRLLAEMLTPGLFSPCKLILVRDGKKLLKAAPQELADLLDSCPEGNRLCVFTESLDGRTTLARRLKKAGCLVECRKLYADPAFFRGGGSEPSELARWVSRRAEARGLVLEADAAEFLISLTGNNLFLIDSELEKLEMASERGVRIGTADVEEATGMSALHTPFDLWEHMEKGNVRKALETLKVILRNGLRSQGGALITDHAGVAAILLKIFRDRIRLAAATLVMHHEGMKDSEIQAKLGVRSPFYFKKIKGYARTLTARKYPGLHRAVLEAERRIKRMGQAAVAVLEEAVVRIAMINKERS